jgi:signal peptidase I
MAKNEKRRIPSAAELPQKPKGKGAEPAPSSGNPIADFFASKAVRETIESVAIAFVLAFLFRTFEAEAFVIPTGSMAPTLMGQHKDQECPACGKRYSTGSSEGNVGFYGPVVGTTCPDCRYVNRFPPNDPQYPTYTGDRILVSKFIYDLQEPERWDVVVFKFPHNAKQNYIKRLVGKPHETIRLRHGDVWTRDDLPAAPPADFHIARKPPDKITAMLQDVYDSHHLPEVLVEAGWPERWQNAGNESASSVAAENVWQPTGEVVERGESRVVERGYKLAQPTPGVPVWLRYHHVPPSVGDWEAIAAGKQATLPSDQLITDFYAYNASMQSSGNWRNADYQLNDSPLGLHWVGDLALEADVDVQGSTGTLLLDLVEAGRRHQCAINVADGTATLSITSVDGSPGQFADDHGEHASETVRGETSVRGPGRFHLRLANVDNQLTLWVDGRVVKFDGPTTYPTPQVEIPQWSDTDPGDLAPAGIGSDGVALDVKQLQVKRDIYYIAVNYDKAKEFGLQDYDLRKPLFEIREVLEHPRGVYQQDPERFHRLFVSRRTVDFPLGADQFFPMGDNSPQSQDARMWDNAEGHYVDRRYLLGKALFIYWPHATKLGPIPFIPNFEQMEFVR